MVTYEQWNRAIIKHIFEACDPGETVFLNTTSETLSEIAEQEGFNVDDAVESLKEAVRKKVVVENIIPPHKVWLFRVDPRHFINYTPEKDPPQVAFLALSVLAASMMESENSIAAFDYFSRLNQVLIGQLIKDAPKGFDRPLFQLCWKHLQRWAHKQHDVELYLTEGPTNQKYVWLPISQCLISNRYRRNIYLFFQHFNLTPFSKVQDEKLESDLHAWLSSSSGSAKIIRYFSKETYKQSILNQVKNLLEHWDGIIPPSLPTYTRHRSSLIRVELQIKMLDTQIRYWLRRRERDEIGLEDNLLGVESLQTFNSEKWFRPQTDKKNAFWNLSNDLQFKTAEKIPIVYTLGHSDIWVFRVDKECDEGWISHRNMHLNEDHLIVFKEWLREQVINCLSQTSGQKCEDPNPVYVDEAENGWLYLRTTPTKIVTFSDSILWRLSVKSSEQISFGGGLLVQDEYNHRAYLDICLPTIYAPDIGLPDEEPLQINEVTYSIDENRCVTLDNNFKPGDYQIKYGTKTRDLRVISPDHTSKQKNKTLVASFNKDPGKIPIYSEETIAEITDKSGVWLTGAKFYGKDIPDGESSEIRLDPNQSFKSHSEIISSVVKLAIQLKKNRISVPEWFDEAIKSIDQNACLRTLVQKKLRQYKEKALSYDDLRKRGGE